MGSHRGGRQATAEEYDIELIKQQLLPPIKSEDIEAGPNESASKSCCSIFRVPQALAKGFAEACQPRIVSVGPYHHGEPQLQTVQGHKRRYLHAMLDRTQPHGVHLENLIDVVARKVKMIRRCYSESTDNFSTEDLVQMMVLDGCFIIEFLREQRLHPDDILLKNSFEVLSIQRDLVRLENQVPYFVLEDLFEMMNVPEEPFSLADLALSTFASFGEGLQNASETAERWGNPVHLLELFSWALIPLDQPDKRVDESSSDYTIRSASELRRVGIRFKKREASTFLDINFDRKSRAIGIPKVAIYDEELSWILTNMVAFEQCCGQSDGQLTAYAMFMGCLVRTADDVQLLRDCKVISNQGMSNKDFARFFSEICNEVSFDSNRNYLSSHVAILNKSLKYERAYLCWAHLMNAFLDNPWSVVSGLAIVVTLAGMISTVYAVLQYYHPK